jgi:hypothetical protein
LLVPALALSLTTATTIDARRRLFVDDDDMRGIVAAFLVSPAHCRLVRVARPHAHTTHKHSNL